MGDNDLEPGQPWLGSKHGGQEPGPRQGRKQVRPLCQPSLLRLEGVSGPQHRGMEAPGPTEEGC